MRCRAFVSCEPYALRRGVLFVGVAGQRLHVVRGHCQGESPVDEGQSCEEAYHHHVLCVAGFKEEESDNHQEHAVDKVEPPVAVAAAASA